MCLIFNFPVIFRSTPRQVSTALSRAKKLKKNKSNDKNGWAKYYTHQPQSRFPSSCLTRESPYTMFVNGSHRSLFYFFCWPLSEQGFFLHVPFFFGAATTTESGWDGWWEHIDMEAQEWERKTFALIQLFFFASLTTTSGGDWKSARRKEKFSVFFFAFTQPSNFEGCVMKLVALLNGVDRVVGQPVDFVQLMMIHFLNLLEANDFSVLSNTAKWKIDFVSVCHFVSPEHAMSHLVRNIDYSIRLYFSKKKKNIYVSIIHLCHNWSPMSHKVISVS